MRISRSALMGGSAAVGILVLILDSRSALNGATLGVNLCIQSIIPTLFPFFVLSTILIRNLSSRNASIFRLIGRLCGIPVGRETVLLAGLLGGYPVGAQCSCQLYADQKITKAESGRLLGFCSNAGPAFIFGMSGCLFQNKWAPFTIWVIHILCALITGTILPNKSYTSIQPSTRTKFHLTEGIQSAIRSMTLVCAWVILFRIAITFGERWFLWLLPRKLQIALKGAFELTNGYLELTMLQNERLRFIYASIFLAFGGLCVMLQTASIVNQAGLDLGFYLPGKMIQATFSAILSYWISGYLYHEDTKLSIPLVISSAVVSVFIILRKFTQIGSRNPVTSDV